MRYVKLDKFSLLMTHNSFKLTFKLSNRFFYLLFDIPLSELFQKTQPFKIPLIRFLCIYILNSSVL